MSHTTGPWKIRINGTLTGRGPEVYKEGAHFDDGGEFVVADCGCMEATQGLKRWKRLPDAEEIEANARLIAAAPDLLEACKVALDSLNMGSTLGAPILERAIAKAEGK